MLWALGSDREDKVVVNSKEDEVVEWSVVVEELLEAEVSEEGIAAKKLD